MSQLDIYGHGRRGVTLAITQVTGAEARELLACMKFMISMERIGDLLLSFASSAQSAGPRIDPQDTRDLTHMATVLEKMLADVGAAFATRDVKKAVDVLRADAEMDRLRNLIFLRHIENPEGSQRQASLQVIFMTLSLERALGPRQESGGGSLPLRQRPHHPPHNDGL
jgi:phosphate uptake regulator